MAHVGKRRQRALAREAELDRVRQRWQIGTGAAVVVVGALAWLAWPRGPVIQNKQPAVVQLRALLLEFRRADGPARAKIVSRHQGQKVRLMARLRKIVADGDHPQRLVAADFAAMLRSAHGYARSYQIVAKPGAGGGGGGNKRPRGGHALSSSQGRFGDLSKHGFSIRRGRADADSLGALLDAFGDDDDEIRRAALRAIPSPLPTQARAVLMRFAREAIGPAERCAIEAVAKQPIDEATEEFLIAKLGTSGPAIRAAVLDGLARKARPLTYASALYNLALDPACSLKERARAVRALDSTRSLGMVDRLEECTGSPQVDYFVGRCLVSAGRLSGLRRLIRLVVESTTAEERSATQAIEFDCRRILSALSGHDVSDVPSTWGRWLQKLQGLEPQVLPPSRVILNE